jgi:hypothetical protein
MRNQWLSLPAALAVIGLTPVALAADHADGTVAAMDPAADITDLYAWVSPDGAKTYLVMDVFPFAHATATDAGPVSKFSNTVQYVFHTTSQATYLAAATPLNVICTFDAAQAISCWAGAEYVHGDPSNTSGLVNSSGKLRVFAGLRDDPFFFNLAGFSATAAAVRAAKGSLTFDVNGCPLLNQTTSQSLVTLLSTDPSSDGGPAKDLFLGLNLLAIVVEVDTTVLTAGGPVVGVWASTNRAGQ